MSESAQPTDGTNSTDAGQVQDTTPPVQDAPSVASQENAGEPANDTPTDAGDAAGEVVDGDKSESKDAPQGAPEKYEFAFPEGYQTDAAVMGEFETVSRELGLTQEQAQKLADFGPKIAQLATAEQAKVVEAAKAEWLEAAKNDREFGGDKYDANLAISLRGLEAYGTPELSKLLHESGLERHPEVVRVFWRIGKTVSEDTVVTGARGEVATEDRAKLLFPSMKN